MKTKGKAWQLVVTALLIVVFVYTAFFGVAAKYGDVTTTYIKGAKDIRFGVDIKGGVNVTFVPSDGYDATDEQLDAARLVIENRLVALNVTDYELYVDNNSDSLILEFPWQSGETDFDPESAIQEIGTTAYLTFREGASKDGELILDGSMVESASAQYGAVSNGGSSEYYVALKFTTEGAKAFGDATTKLAADKGSISIWLDDENVSTATVNTAITDGQAIITSSASNPFTQDAVVKMARQINSGALPFALSVDSYSTVSPSLGENSLGAMVLAGLIAFALIVVFMTVLYRLPGFLACIALAGQVAATLAFVSGYFPVFESFTLTLPGIAGIILAIGMGVDANVITAERIKEELKNGKSLDGALKSGFARGLTPIIDGNVTIVIVAIVLMGAFGPSDGLFAKALHFVFFAFGPSTAGTIYAFGYTLLTGVLLNFVFGVFATRVMIRGAAAIKALRNPWLYGAAKPGQEKAEKKPVDFVSLRKKFLTFSACLMAVILLCAAVFGVHLDTEFTGGAMITLSYEGSFDQVRCAKDRRCGAGKHRPDPADRRERGHRRSDPEDLHARHRDRDHRAGGEPAGFPERELPGQPVCPAVPEQCQRSHGHQVPTEESGGCGVCTGAHSVVYCPALQEHRRSDRRYDGSAGAGQRPDGGVRHLCVAAHRTGWQFYRRHAHHPRLLHQRYRCGVRPYP